MLNIDWLRPEALWLLLPLVLLVTYLIQQEKKKGSWSAICDPHLLNFLSLEQARKKPWLSIAAIFFTGLLLILALSGPSLGTEKQQGISQRNSVVIALDLSTAMNAKDILPSRMERARFKLKDLLSALTDSEVGLIAFTGESFLISPLTQDLNTLKLFVPELSPTIMPTQGNNLSQALTLSQSLLEKAGKSHGHVILITANNANDNDIALAKSLRHLGIAVSVIGVGTKIGAPTVNQKFEQVISRLDDSSLKHLASAGGGIYRSLSASDGDVEAIKHTVNQGRQHYEQSKQTLQAKSDEGIWLVYLTLPFLLLSFRRGWLEGIV